MVLYTYLHLFHFLTLVLGMGSIEANEGSEGSDDPEELANDSWMGLLDLNDGVYSFKPLEDVKANKVNLGRALRHIMRQAWGKCHQIVNIYFLNLVFGLRKIRQKGTDYLGCN